MQAIPRQAAFLACMDVFRLIAFGTVIAIPLVFLLRGQDTGNPSKVGSSSPEL
jgi:hypothetical protein